MYTQDQTLHWAILHADAIWGELGNGAGMIADIASIMKISQGLRGLQSMYLITKCFKGKYHLHNEVHVLWPKACMQCIHNNVLHFCIQRCMSSGIGKYEPGVRQEQGTVHRGLGVEGAAAASYGRLPFH